MSTATPEQTGHSEQAERPVAAPLQERVYVWDRVVRITHWSIALSLAVLAVTGIYMGDPYVGVPGEARDHFVMGTFKVVHFYAAIVFTLAVLSRLVWMFVGSRHARWRQFVPTSRRRRRQLIETFKFYTFIKDRPPEVIGHNPLAGAAYAVIFGLYLVMIVTGLGLYGMQAHVGSPLAWFAGLVDIFGGAQDARWWHHIVMWLLIGFFVHHLYSALLTAITEKNGTLESIFSGWKWFRRGAVEEDAVESDAKDTSSSGRDS